MSYKQHEACLIRRPRPFCRQKWTALGQDIHGTWVETFYSHNDENEARKTLQVLTVNRFNCQVHALERA